VVSAIDDNLVGMLDTDDSAVHRERLADGRA
jgi:hypothetical protein